jgi:hypothetical protein
VYNIEVQVAHVYHVSPLGILVHNPDFDHRNIVGQLVGNRAVNIVDMPARGLVPVERAAGVVYFVFDKDSGELLKVGSTGKPNSGNTMTTRYRAWATAEVDAWENQGWRQRNLEFRYVTVESRGAALDLEDAWRRQIDGGRFGDVRMPWDFARSRGERNGLQPREFGGTSPNAPSLRDLPMPCRR